MECILAPVWLVQPWLTASSKLFGIFHINDYTDPEIYAWRQILIINIELDGGLVMVIPSDLADSIVRSAESLWWGIFSFEYDVF